MTTAEVCRKHGLSQGTFHKFKSKYGGMEVSDAAKLRALEDENAKLKRLLADQMLDNVVRKDLPGKNRRHQLSGGAPRSVRCAIMTSRGVGRASSFVGVDPKRVRRERPPDNPKIRKEMKKRELFAEIWASC